MLLWRISNYATLDGMGGVLQSARWHSAGKPIIYAADHPSSCLLEMLVNTDVSLLPDQFQLLKIQVPDNLKSEIPTLDKNWRLDQAISRKTGDAWLNALRSPLLRVPSAILPEVYNTLINPLHINAQQLKILSAQSVPLDNRLR